jgi:hypothetical protein
MAVWRDMVAMPNGHGATNWVLLRLLSDRNAEVIREISSIAPARLFCRCLRPAAGTTSGSSRTRRFTGHRFGTCTSKRSRSKRLGLFRLQ